MIGHMDSQAKPCLKRCNGFQQTYSERLQAYIERPQHFDELVAPDPTRIKWNREIKNRMKRKQDIPFSADRIRISAYRPYTKEFIYFEPMFFNTVALIPLFFPFNANNTTISVARIGGASTFSTLITDEQPNLRVVSPGQNIPKNTHDVGETDSVFVPPNPPRSNIAISVGGVGGNKPFSTLICDSIPEIQLLTNGQVFPRYTYEEIGRV